MIVFSAQRHSGPRGHTLARNCEIGWNDGSLFRLRQAGVLWPEYGSYLVYEHKYAHRPTKRSGRELDFGFSTFQHLASKCICKISWNHKCVTMSRRHFTGKKELKATVSQSKAKSASDSRPCRMQVVPQLVPLGGSLNLCFARSSDFAIGIMCLGTSGRFCPLKSLTAYIVYCLHTVLD